MSEERLIPGEEWMQRKREVLLQGAYNMRDMGGYPAAKGRYVAMGRVYRSDDLGTLSGQDVAELEKREIVTVIDFRASEEVAVAPNKRLVTVVNSLHLGIDPGNVISFKEIFAELDEKKSSAMMMEINRALVREFQSEYARFFDVLMKSCSSPLLFHCSAGKDRTGFAAALFLASLGVDREIIMEDYLESKANAERKYAKDLAHNPALYPLVTVKREYLEAAFQVMEEEYGGVESYLKIRLHVDLDRMKELYTVPSV